MDDESRRRHEGREPMHPLLQFHRPSPAKIKAKRKNRKRAQRRVRKMMMEAQAK